MASDKRFVIVGAGMSGILTAIKLLEAGNRNFTIYEKASELGGTWRENTYPGVACDVPSHLYCYSFALNPDWSHVFSYGNEIFDYFKNVANRFNVEPFIRYNQEVISLDYKDNGKWLVKTNNGLTDEADFVIAATGVLHHPNYPVIEGIERFNGAIFHSARWDHSVDLTGKKVGIIGTGSTAVQIVSAIVDKVEDLYLFQRTPQWVLYMENPEISESERQRYRENPQLLVELRNNYSKAFAQYFANAVVDSQSEQLELIQKLCLENLENNVKDPDLREKLRPKYRAGCKRLIVSPDFYQSITKDNAHLVVDPIVAIEPTGIKTKDSGLIDLDVIVLATGFRVDQFIRPTKVHAYGLDLDDYWGDFPRAYYSISVPHFPNLFFLNGPNGPVGNFSLIEVAELQLAYIFKLIDYVSIKKAKAVFATDNALDQFETQRLDAVKHTVWVTGCHSWYLDKRGVPAVWPWSFDHFREVMNDIKLNDYELVSA